MSTTVLEALQNARHNLSSVHAVGPIEKMMKDTGISQLDNAILALENGKAADWELQENMFADVKTGDTS